MPLLLALALQGEVDASSPEPLSLSWLARQQKADGSWGGVENTSLVLAAFFGAGYCHNSGETFGGCKVKDVIKRGMASLMALDPAKLSTRDAAFRAMAINEGYGQTGAKKYKVPAESATSDLVSRQKDDGGWGDRDESAWAMLALKSADLAGTTFDDKRGVFARAGRYAESMASIGLADVVRSRAAVRVDVPAIRDLGHDDPEVRERAMTSIRSIGEKAGPALLEAAASDDLEVAARASALLEELFLRYNTSPVAQSLACQLFFKRKKDVEAIRTAELLVSERAASSDDGRYWTLMGLRRYDGPCGKLWSSLEPGISMAIKNSQHRGGASDVAGSWDAATPDERIRVTALNTLTLWIGCR